MNIQLFSLIVGLSATIVKARPDSYEDHDYNYDLYGASSIWRKPKLTLMDPCNCQFDRVITNFAIKITEHNVATKCKKFISNDDLLENKGLAEAIHESVKRTAISKPYIWQDNQGNFYKRSGISKFGKVHMLGPGYRKLVLRKGYKIYKVLVNSCL